MESSRYSGKKKATAVPVLPPRIPTPMPPPNNNNSIRSSRVREQNTKVHPSSVGLDIPKLISKDSYKLLDNDVKTAWINPRLISKVDMHVITSKDYMPPEVRNMNGYYNHNLSHQKQGCGRAHDREWESAVNGRAKPRLVAVPTLTQTAEDAKRDKTDRRNSRSVDAHNIKNINSEPKPLKPAQPRPQMESVFSRTCTPSPKSCANQSKNKQTYAHQSHGRSNAQRAPPVEAQKVKGVVGYQSRVDYVGGGFVGHDSGVFGMYSETRYAFAVNGLPGNPAQTSAAAAFFARHSEKESHKLQLPKCNHGTGVMQCRTLAMNDIQAFHDKFYKTSNKIRQDQFITRFCVVSLPKRKRPRTINVNTPKPKGKTVIYFIPKQNSEVRVCRKTFLDVLGIGKHRLNGIIDRFANRCDLTEMRGGDRKSKIFKNKLEAVKAYIKTLKANESQYCRGKSIRQYLPSDLNITTLYKMYDAQQANPELKVKLSYFRHVFNTCFNVGFGCPKTDACSTCLSLTEKIKLAKDLDKKRELQTMKKVHKLRANAFFDNVKEKREGLMIFSYDCQKNLVLPKVPDQKAYYSRQLYCYNFAVVRGSSKSPLREDNVFLYSWLEHERLKGSNEIASALYNCLQKNETKMEGINTVRLISDGCAGQNKNCTILAMVAKWLREAPKCVKEVQIVFPVTGHSYIPPDRVFGVIEKKLKRLDTISVPQEYHTVFKKHGTLLLVGEDWTVQDWKKQATTTIKAPASLHFKISKIKRLILRPTKKGGIKVKGELTYRSEASNALGVTKKGKRISDIKPSELPIGVPVKAQKLKDVEMLLTLLYGEEWRLQKKFEMYLNLIGNGTEPPNNENLEEYDSDTPVCEFIAEVGIV